MSWPRDPFVSDGSYTTPLPQQPCEAALWRAVTSLYQYSSLEALLKVRGPAATAAPASPVPADCKPASAAEAPHAGAPEEVKGIAVPCSRVSATSSPALATRAEVMVRRSAFIAAADAAMPLRTPSPSLTPSVTSPLATSVAANLENPPALPLPRSPTAPTVASRLPRSRSAGSWSDKGDSLASSPTTAYIRAACRCVLEPVQALLTQFNADKLHVGASVVDVAVQHPLPCLRVELVRLLLMFKRWNWSMCAPVAVAAGVGDMDVLTRLLSVEELEPNLGFPLRVAVQCHQNEQVLPFLVSHHRIKPNYGSAFYAAVVMGNTEAMHILGAAAGVDVNHFVNSEGTSALLYALRQFLMCSSIAAAEQQPPPTTASAAMHSRKPQRGITPPSLPLPSTAEQGVRTISPFLAGGGNGGARAPAKHGFHSPSSDDADGSGAASSSAAAATYGGAPSASVSSKAMGPLWQRDKTLFRNASAAWAMDDLHEGATAAAHGEDRDVQHSPAFRQDTAIHRLRTPQHWKAVLLYLLDHPAIEVNSGFYTTPLQMAVLAGNVEVVAWLLQHPHLSPNRLPKAASVLRDSYCLVQRQSLSEDALQRLIATPVEMAVQLHQVEAFKLLVRDQRVRMPVRLIMDLERLAWSAEAIPYLTILAQHRADWEGWGWRSRRQCLLIATAASCVVALCSWAVWCAWYHSLQACGVVLLCTYAVQVVMTIILFAREAYTVRATSSAAQQPAAKPAPVLAAFVQHLLPAWSGAWQCGASAVLLLCPGMVPVLDLLCAWSLYKIHRSRRPLQTAARAGYAAPAASPQHRPFGPTDSPTSHAGLSHASRERVDRARRQSMWFSSTARGWSGLSVASNVSGHDSFTEAPWTANFSLKESFSCPRPAKVRTRRQVLTGGGVQRRLHTGGGSPASAAAEGAASASAHRVIACTVGHATASDGEFVFRTVSPIVTNSITFSPSVGRRDPWVVPGRPSRFAVSTEYHAPDLTLRALAYVTYDWLLVAPRLLLSIVGIFMFMHMVFPSSPPAASSPPVAMVGDGSVLRVDRATPPLSATVVSDGIATQSIFTLHHCDRPLSAVPTGAAAMTVETNSADLPRFTTMMSLVGLCGLVASIVSGAVLLAMATSLRSITTQSFFASPKSKRSADFGRGGDGLVLRHCEWDGPRRAADSRAD
ncbi:hypothetical protein, unknown function [Leishmania donovani]|uniref:Uncharacterized protein n=1 Tax=Leishmania donovani TaxID=5661 RepID=E9BHI6_LEIDO|nr:hypothetical protein, unknown function [Leishmania donovani]AYU79414.1 hypothetical protein LdCL_250013500 [Leishmania donovani]CBZ34712.1 hypothetical protein, unknown function [Leishmania donovani]